MEMSLKERHMLCAWQDHVTRLHKFFIQKTGSKALLADFYAAIHSEIIYLRRQYPGVRERKIIQRAYDRILEAYERSAEFPVYLNWRSIASFTVTRRSGIAWAVLQARSDHKYNEKPILKDNEKPFMVKKVRTSQMGWCRRCYINSKIVNGKFQCCGNEVVV